jgi:hypothetical protein
MATPSARCFPRDDREFARDVEAHLGADGAAPTPAELLRLLREKYPHVRIVERSALAAIEPRPVWYVYRDGRPLAGRDGAGARRVSTRIEALTNQSLDLIEWSSEAMRRSEAALAAADRAIRPRRVEEATRDGQSARS